MRRIILPAIVLLAGLGQFARAAVDVTAVYIRETRAIQFGDEKLPLPPPGMVVVLSLLGPEAESSVQYGSIKVDEAVDDLGDNLVSTNDPFNEPAMFKGYANANSFVHGPKTKPIGRQMELTLAVPKRAATKIARLRGSVTIANRGTIQSVELGNLKNAGKQSLAFPEGVHLGVTADFAADAYFAAGYNAHSIGIEITGDEALLESIKVVDASGNIVSVGMSMSTQSFNFSIGKRSSTVNSAQKLLMLSRPVDDSMKLVVKFASDRKLTVVPFDLDDISLP